LKKIIVLTLTLVFLGLNLQSVYANTNTYVVDQQTLQRVPIPLAYEVTDVFKNFGDTGFMNHAEDLFIDSKDNIYIADTENNRVLKMDTLGNILHVFTQADGKDLNNPKGVYVDEQQVVWIADTGNKRIVTINPDFSDRKTYIKPDTTLLGENFTFEPSKIYVNKAGYIYILRGSSLISIDEANNFRGYIGAKEVGFNLGRTLIRMFGTQSQKDRTLKQSQDSYSNFVIAEDGMIYGAISNSQDGDQIRRLNSVGKNTFPSAEYSERSKGPDGVFKLPELSDISVQQDGIVTILDKGSGKIYQYDQDGNMLTAFGGIGSYKGTFQIAVSLDFDSEGNLYVLDYNANLIQKFKPTEFIKNVHKAVKLHNDGKYDEANDYWNKVLDINPNYYLAQKGIGKVDLKLNHWDDAMQRYTAALDKEGYSKAFSKYRHQLFRKYFFFVVIAIVVILVIFIKLFVLMKKKADYLVNDIEMKRRTI
jgi:hypothetical protein